MSINYYLYKVESGLVSIEEFIKLVDTGVIKPDEVLTYLKS